MWAAPRRDAGVDTRMRRWRPRRDSRNPLLSLAPRGRETGTAGRTASETCSRQGKARRQSNKFLAGVPSEASARQPEGTDFARGRGGRAAANHADNHIRDCSGVCHGPNVPAKALARASRRTGWEDEVRGLPWAGMGQFRTHALPRGQDSCLRPIRGLYCGSDRWQVERTGRSAAR